MDDFSNDRIGTVLRRMAEDLVSERRRANLLERENRRLRKQLDELRHLIVAYETSPAVARENPLDPTSAGASR